MMELKFNDRKKMHILIGRCDAHATEEMIREYAKNAVFCALQLIMHKESDFSFHILYQAVIYILSAVAVCFSNSLRSREQMQ